SRFPRSGVRDAKTWKFFQDTMCRRVRRTATNPQKQAIVGNATALRAGFHPSALFLIFVAL
ncbi:MAG: hypothetical protein ACK57O_01700, partial [Planctomyces sp.]